MKPHTAPITVRLLRAPTPVRKLGKHWPNPQAGKLSFKGLVHSMPKFIGHLQPLTSYFSVGAVCILGQSYVYSTSKTQTFFVLSTGLDLKSHIHFGIGITKIVFCWWYFLNSNQHTEFVSYCLQVLYMCVRTIPNVSALASSHALFSLIIQYWAINNSQIY